MNYAELPDRLAHLKPRLSTDPWGRNVLAAGRVHLLKDEDSTFRQNKGNTLDVAAVMRAQPNSVFSLGGMGDTPMEAKRS